MYLLPDATGDAKCKFKIFSLSTSAYACIKCVILNI